MSEESLANRFTIHVALPPCVRACVCLSVWAWMEHELLVCLCLCLCLTLHGHPRDEDAHSETVAQHDKVKQCF